jgi:tektin-2
MESSKRLRENIQQTMAQSSSDLVAQRNATDFALRRRLHEAQQARDELDWQKKQVSWLLDLRKLNTRKSFLFVF